MKFIRDTDLIIFDNGDVYRKGKKYSTIKTNKGYLCIRPTINKKKTYLSIHREVAKAFVPNPNNYPIVNHIDGNPINNHFTNLEWVTASENQIHKVQVLKKGINGNSRSRLTIEDIIWIRENAIQNDKNFGYSAIARKYNTCAKSISRIVNMQRWKYV